MYSPNLRHGYTILRFVEVDVMLINSEDIRNRGIETYEVVAVVVPTG